MQTMSSIDLTARAWPS